MHFWIFTILTTMVQLGCNSGYIEYYRTGWDRKALTSKITFMLIKKSWRVKGVTFDEVVDEYPDHPDKAINILMNNWDLQFVEAPLTRGDEIFTMKNKRGEVEYDPNLDSIVYIYGTGVGDRNTTQVMRTMTALAMRNLHKKYNIFIVNSEHMETHRFISCIKMIFGKDPKMQVFAEIHSELIVQGVRGGHLRPRQVHLIGYSFSGNMLGYMGRHIHSLFQEKVASMLAIEPFSTDWNTHVVPVSHEDADTVHVIDTTVLLGTKRRIATANFVFDAAIGAVPGTYSNTFKRLWFIFLPFEVNSRSHNKSISRWWWVILFPSKFLARRCDSYTRFMHCLCEDHSSATITFPLNNKAKGTYQIRTGPHHPYGLGEEGSKCSEKKRRRSLLK